jgi:hypothetical protein
MNYFLGLMLLVVFLVLPRTGEGNPLPVSANGFTCHSAGMIVTCKGNFPGHEAPTLTGVGSNTVGIIAQYPDHVWSYQSDTGCLCRGSVQTMECAFKTGKRKVFQGPSAVQASSTWCKHGY